jgi:SPP1 family predicted phage head-tail adaptor
MKQVLQFQIPDKSSDGTGGQNEEYNKTITVRGKVKMKKGLRDFQTGYDQSIKVYNCWVPWRNAIEANVTKDWRVIFEARSFSIEFFTMVDEQRRIYHMELTEVR